MTTLRRTPRCLPTAFVLLAVAGACVGCLRVEPPGPGPEPEPRPDPQPTANVAHEASVVEARLLAALCRELADNPPESEAELGETLTAGIKGLRDEAFKPVSARIKAAFEDGYNREAARAVLTELATGFEEVN